jgi:hypothetical protein
MTIYLRVICLQVIPTYTLALSENIVLKFILIRSYKSYVKDVNINPYK